MYKRQQYNQLIARRVRDNNVYAEILPYTAPLSEIKEGTYKGIIFTGGPNSCLLYTSKTVRTATMHTVGDSEGYIATGVQTSYKDVITGYNFVDGIYNPVSYTHLDVYKRQGLCKIVALFRLVNYLLRYWVAAVQTASAVV